MKLKGSKKNYTPKDSDSVECQLHNIKTTWGELDPYQQLAVESGLDIKGDVCILAKEALR